MELAMVAVTALAVHHFVTFGDTANLKRIKQHVSLLKIKKNYSHIVYVMNLITVPQKCTTNCRLHLLF